MGNAVKKQKSRPKADPQRILTPEFRASYPHVLKPNSVEGGAPSYSVVMLFDKEEDLSVLKAAMKAAKVEKYGVNPKNWPKLNTKHPLVNDGDSEQFSDKEGYAGHWVIKATSSEENPPQVFDDNGADIVSSRDFKAGDYAKAHLYCAVWENKFGKGVKFYLNGIMKVRDGEALGSSRTSSKEAFGITAGADSDDESESFGVETEAEKTDSDW